MNGKIFLVAGALCAAAAVTSASAQIVISPPNHPPLDCWMTDACDNPPRDCYVEGEVVRCPQATSTRRQEYPQVMSTGRCVGNVCRISVRAVGPCKVSVSPEFTFISTQNVKILWELVAAGNFAFDETRGIEFKAAYNPTYPQQFTAGMRVDPRTWQYIDANTQPGSFRYTINVYNTRTGQACSLDPGVVNDWP